jgi:hypothetical protein
MPLQEQEGGSDTFSPVSPILSISKLEIYTRKKLLLKGQHGKINLSRWLSVVRVAQ